MQTVVDKINYVQKKLGINNSYLAHLINYTPGYIALLKSGLRKPSDKFLSALADFLEISSKDLKDENRHLLINKNENLTVNERLANLRKEKGLSQASLSKKIHIPITTISSMENSKNLPSVKLISVYSSFFHISKYKLLLAE